MKSSDDLKPSSHLASTSPGKGTQYKTPRPALILSARPAFVRVRRNLSLQMTGGLGLLARGPRLNLGRTLQGFDALGTKNCPCAPAANAPVSGSVSECSDYDFDSRSRHLATVMPDYEEDMYDD
jgi:hypothetical protein